VEVSYSYTVYDWGNNPYLAELEGNYLLSQSNSMISLGFGRKKSVQTVYATDKFGKVKHFDETHFYGDVLIGFGAKFPPLFRAFYADQTYPNEITSIQQLAVKSGHTDHPCPEYVDQSFSCG